MKDLFALFHPIRMAATLGMVTTLWLSQLPAASETLVIDSITRYASGDVLLTWGAIPGRTYAIEYKSDLTQANWIHLAFIVAMFETEAIWDSPGGDLRRFYRMILDPTTSPGSKPAVFRTGGEWHLRNLNTSGSPDNSFTFTSGQANEIPIMGDWNGDGTRTPGVFKDGQWWLRNSNSSGPGDLSFWFGDPGDIPVSGDWDGNGTETIGVFRNSTGVWYLRNANSTAPPDITFMFGDPNDIPITGDWNGNGFDTIGVFRKGTFYLRNTNSTGPADITIAFGSAGDKPVVGDWNNNGVTTIGVVSGSTRLLRNSNSAGLADITFDFGFWDDTHLVWR